MLSFVPETEDDTTSIRDVVTAAFGRTSEANLVEAIRNSLNFIPQLSIVAKEDGDMLGHVMFSAIAIAAQNRTIPALALAPLSVIPARQREGIGSQLVQLGLSKCRQLDHSIVVVLGEPHYYRRFDFQTANQFGVQAPFPVPDDAFMVLQLKPGALKGVSTVQYPKYFDEV